MSKLSKFISSRLGRKELEGKNIEGYFITEQHIDNGTRWTKIEKGTYNEKLGFVRTGEIYDLTKDKDGVLIIEKPGIMGCIDYVGFFDDAYSCIVPFSIVDKDINKYFEKTETDLPKQVDVSPLERTLAKYPLELKRLGVMLGEHPNGVAVPAYLLRPMFFELYLKSNRK